MPLTNWSICAFWPLIFGKLIQLVCYICVFWVSFFRAYCYFWTNAALTRGYFRTRDVYIMASYETHIVVIWSRFPSIKIWNHLFNTGNGDWGMVGVVVNDIRSRSDSITGLVSQEMGPNNDAWYPFGCPAQLHKKTVLYYTHFVM